MSDGGEQLFTINGARKYVSSSERWRFIDSAEASDLQTRALCHLLAYCGCRVSEALALTPAQIDVETGCVVFRTLKRRRQCFRAVPVPPELMADLRSLASGLAADARLWGWCRKTAWLRVKGVMRAADVTGAQAMPKALRHGFGIANAQQNVPPALTQRWMGHARLETTAIYQHAVGDEERAFAERIWRRSGKRRH